MPAYPVGEGEKIEKGGLSSALFAALD